MLCYKCQNQIPDYSLVCTKCGAELSVKARQKAHMGTGAGAGPIPNALPQPMMWYFILVSFYLFFDAASSLFTAAEYIFGPFKFMSTADGTEFIANFSQIGKQYKIIDIIYGSAFVLFAVWAVIVRFKLAKFKKNAPTMLLLYLAIPSVIGLAYNVALIIVAKLFTFEECMVLAIQLAIQGAIVYANYIYFKKRKSLFKN